MKKINELQSERLNLIEKMDTIVKLAETEKRSKSEDEVKNWDEHNARIEAIDAEIKVLERQEELNKSVVKRTIETPEEKVAKRYDLSKAISEASKGGLTGLEKEMHQEAKNELRSVSGAVGNLYIPEILISSRANEETKTTGSSGGHIPLDVANLGLVVATPLYREVGATVYSGLAAGKLDLPYSQGHAAAAVSEGSAASQSNPTKTKGTLTATRYQGWQKYTQEYLAESSIMNQMMADMVSAIDRGIGDALIDEAVGKNVMTGAATSDTAAVLTWANTLAMFADLTGDNFVNEGFVISKALFYALAAKDKSTSTAQFIVNTLNGKNRGMIAGVPAYGTGFLPLHDTNKYDIIYADWKQASVGLWGGVQLLVDPYSASDNGYVKITFGRLADVDINPYAVNSRRNIKLA